ncbi:MAG: hypothetical protein A2Y93_08465 [Chloroflexi bacterium RBG_13_68_17]|jgi:DNA-binding transcriptional ArsR family regulator|nr:MAG: hypothetical protein A2Y93_08465 [Chloroflexi bacterium RBG_13_68_17]
MTQNAIRLETRAHLLQGLAEPSRLAILEALRRGPACVSDLVDQTGLTQPNVSNHLACLRDCGLVTSRPQGRFVYYALADPDVRILLEQIDRVLRRAGPQIDACPRYQPAAAHAAQAKR